MIRRSFAATLIGILYLGQVVPCLVITGCSKDHNGTKPETASTTDRATAQDGKKVAIAAKDQEIAQTSDAPAAVAKADREKDEAVARANTERDEANFRGPLARKVAVVAAGRDEVAETASTASIRRVATTTGAIAQLQALIRGDRAQEEVISQQDAALLAGAAALGEYMTNHLFTWQSKSKQEAKYAQEHEKLANGILALEEALPSPAMIDFDTTPISQVNNSTCVSGTRLFVPPRVSVSQAVPLGLCTLLAGSYIAREIQCYKNALSAAKNEAVVGANRVAAETAEAARATTKPDNTATAMQKEEKANDDASGPEEILKSSGTSHISDLSNNEDGISSIDGDHTQTTYVSRDQAIAQEKIQSPERKVGDYTCSTPSVTEADTRSKEGQKTIRDTAPRLVGSNTATLATVKDVTPEALDKAPPVTPDRAGQCGSRTLLNSASKEHAGERKDETEDEDSDWSTATVTEKEKGVSAKFHTESRLGSLAMRQYIEKELPGFEAPSATQELSGSEAPSATFDTSGVKKHKFLYKEEEVGRSKRMVYIALAHDKDENNGAVTGGERSLSIVLKDIKKHIESRTGNRESPIKTLIPLQQIDKGHWTLLEICVNAPAAGSITATHHDSKSWSSFSHVKDIVFPNAGARITKCVQETFSTEKKVKFEYYGEQGIWDFHNCGRYTLIRLRKLLNPKDPKQSIDDINTSLYGGEEQTNAQKKRVAERISNDVRGDCWGGTPEFTRRMPNGQGNKSNTLLEGSTASEDWEMLGDDERSVKQKKVF